LNTEIGYWDPATTVAFFYIWLNVIV